MMPNLFIERASVGRSRQTSGVTYISIMPFKGRWSDATRARLVA